MSGAGVTAPAGPPGRDQGQAKPRPPGTAQGPRGAGPLTPTASQKPQPAGRGNVGAESQGSLPSPTPAAVYVRSQEARWPLTLRTSVGIAGAKGPGRERLSKGPIGRRQTATQRGQCLLGAGGASELKPRDRAQPEPSAQSHGLI